jgi:acyl dehydratase
VSPSTPTNPPAGSAPAGAPRAFEQIEFGEALPDYAPDVSLPNVKRFAKAASMMAGRFIDHEEARQAGLPGAIVPGIMSQGILVALIHRWLPNAQVLSVDTVFRATVLVDSQPVARGVVTDIDEATRVIEVDLMLQNERGETPVVGTARLTV